MADKLRKVLLPEDVSEVEWTGERYVPGVVGPIKTEHLHRYLCALTICRDKEVLDVACGEGYGCYIIAQVAKRVVGVDIDRETIECATKRYGNEHISFSAGDCTRLPLQADSVDVVVSFETIEHIVDHTGFLKEIKRVLRNDGVLIMSTPNRIVASPPDTRPNEFHVLELYKEEFQGLISGFFKNVLFFGQKYMPCSVVCVDAGTSRRKPGDYLFMNSDRWGNVDLVDYVPRPQNVIAVASDSGYEPLQISILEVSDDMIAKLYEEISNHDEEIRALEHDLAETRRALESVYNSTSWKVTAPLRWIAARLRGLRD